MLDNELELIKNIDLIFDKKIVLFGASGLGRHVKNHLSIIGVDVFGYCDNDESKWGKNFNGVNVFSPKELESWEDKKDLVIVVASTYTNEIINQLKNSVLWEVQIYTYVAVEYSILFCSEYKELPKESKMLIEGGYKLWVSDQKRLVEGYNAYARVNELESTNPVLILHPGKVGSSSVHYSLNKRGIYSLHLCDLYYNINCTDNAEIKKYIFEHYKANHHIKIISLIREPVARDISYYFQSTITDPEWHVRGRVSSDFVEDCRKIMMDYTVNREQIQEDNACGWMDYIAMHGKYGTEFDWFDFELKDLFGIDVYAVPFDKQRGYSIIKKDNVEVLIMKMEKLNELEDVIGAYVGLDSFKLINNNVGAEKNYSYMYKELKQKIRLPKEYIDFYYDNNEYYNWFYTASEREMYREKWEAKVE